MGVSVKRHLFTVEDYYKMSDAGILRQEDRVELIQGQLILMSPIKSLHSAIVDTLVEELNFLLRGKAIVKAQNPVRLDNTSEPHPDIAIVKFKKHRYRSRHPHPEDILVLIEVADSSLQLDRKVKLPLYAAAGISCVWIVNLPGRCVEVYAAPEDKAYKSKQVFVPGEEIGLPLLEERIDVSIIFG